MLSFQTKAEGNYELFFTGSQSKEGETAFVFYTGNGLVGLRTIAVKGLINLKSEGVLSVQFWPR